MKYLLPLPIGLILFISLSGCSSLNKLYRGIIPKNVTGDEHSVSVDALPLAEKHCAKFDKKPVFEKMGPIKAYYQCMDGVYVFQGS